MLSFHDGNHEKLFAHYKALELQPHRSSGGWRDSLSFTLSRRSRFTQNITKRHFNLQTFLFTHSEHKAWHLHSAFLLLQRKSCCIATARARVHRNLSTITFEKRGVNVFLPLLNLMCARPYLQLILPFCWRLVHRATVRSFLSSPFHFTAKSHLLSPQRSSHHQFLLKGKSHSHCRARSLFG